MPSLEIEYDNQFEHLLNTTARSSKIAPNATSKPEVIRRAVALYSYLHEQIGDSSDGKRVAIVNKDGRIELYIDPLP